MRALVVALALLAIAVPAWAQQGTVIAAPAVAGALPAQTSNVAAKAGAVGEYAAVNTSAGTGSASISNATPAVVTWSGNPFTSTNCIVAGANTCVWPIYFTGLGGSAGVSNSTNYYVVFSDVSGSTFHLATSIPNAVAGTFVATTGTDSGTAFAAATVASAAVTHVAALNLSAGDWDCTGGAGVTDPGGVTTPTAFWVAINTTGGQPTNNITATFSSAAGISLTAGPVRVLNSALTVASLLDGETWTGAGGNPETYGLLRCRRVQ